MAKKNVKYKQGYLINTLYRTQCNLYKDYGEFIDFDGLETIVVRLVIDILSMKKINDVERIKEEFKDELFEFVAWELALKKNNVGGK